MYRQEDARQRDSLCRRGEAFRFDGMIISTMPETCNIVVCNVVGELRASFAGTGGHIVPAIKQGNTLARSDCRGHRAGNAGRALWGFVSEGARDGSG